jgi:GNAT superfamily N-acetyltransferase
LTNEWAGAARTYVAVSGSLVVGYYSLAVGEVAYDGAPDRLSKGPARHPIPIVLLARLAVNSAWQGRGLGAGLLKDAMRRTLQAADIAGVRVFAAHAEDQRARDCYAHLGFIPSPTDPLHLDLLIEEIRRVAGA